MGAEDSGVETDSPCPLVTVIIATRNRLPLLREAVGSLVSQTLLQWELIIVDDSSEDGTHAWGSSLDDPRITPLRLAQHLERSAARNLGLAHARGPFVMFLDDDDRLAPRALEHLARELGRTPQAVAAVGARLFFDSSGRKWPSYHPPVRLTLVVWKEALASWAPVHGQCLFRTSAVQIVGGYDQRFNVAEDHALWFRVAHSGPVAFYPRCVLEYRLHAGQRSLPNVNVIGLQIRREFVATLLGKERREGERLIRAWSHLRTIEELQGTGRVKEMLSCYLAVIGIAPRLVWSPVTGPPLVKGILRACLGLIVGVRGLERLSRFKSRLGRFLRGHRSAVV